MAIQLNSLWKAAVTAPMCIRHQKRPTARKSTTYLPAAILTVTTECRSAARKSTPLAGSLNVRRKQIRSGSIPRQSLFSLNSTCLALLLQLQVSCNQFANIFSKVYSEMMATAKCTLQKVDIALDVFCMHEKGGWASYPWSCCRRVAD